MSTLVLFSMCEPLFTHPHDGAFRWFAARHAAFTNCMDATITGIICIAIVLIVLICAITFLWWKHMGYEATRKAAERQREWDVEDINRKLDADKKAASTNS